MHQTRGITRRLFLALGAIVFAGASVVVSPARAEPVAPDQMIEKLSTEVLETIKSDPAYQNGNFDKVSSLVDSSIMPHVNFERMTALAVGRGWRSASPEQRESLIREFRVLLLRTYAGALTQVRDDQRIEVKPLRGKPEDEAIVRTQVVGSGEPIQLSYRLERNGDSWRIFDLNVLGVWLIDTYRNQFKQIVNAQGVDGLIQTLAEKNEQFAKAAGRG
ncbi:MAG: ABC transporter substrate-binding protein [Burkholderiaceae bacterium]